MDNYCHSCDFSGCVGGLVVGVGCLCFGGGTLCGDLGVISTGDGFQRSYADLIPLISPLYWFLYMHTFRGSVVSLMRNLDYITDKLTPQKK